MRVASLLVLCIAFCALCSVGCGLDCEMIDGRLVCGCEEGFVSQGGECILENSACVDVDCAGHGQCVIEDKAARCDCDAGYHAEELQCLADETVDVCQGVTCSGHGECKATGQAVLCDCHSGYHAEGLECIQDAVDPCQGVTCANHGKCVVVAQKATCNCEVGFVAEGLECVEDPSCISFANDISPLNKNDCARCHSSGNPKPKIAGDTSDYEVVMQYVNVSDPKAKKGYLWWASGGAGFHRYWPKGCAEYNLFLDWIQQGAKNN